MASRTHKTRICFTGSEARSKAARRPLFRFHAAVRNLVVSQREATARAQNWRPRTRLPRAQQRGKETTPSFSRKKCGLRFRTLRHRAQHNKTKEVSTTGRSCLCTVRAIWIRSLRGSLRGYVHILKCRRFKLPFTSTYIRKVYGSI